MYTSAPLKIKIAFCYIQKDSEILSIQFRLLPGNDTETVIRLQNSYLNSNYDAVHALPGDVYFDAGAQRGHLINKPE